MELYTAKRSSTILAAIVFLVILTTTVILAQESHDEASTVATNIKYNDNPDVTTSSLPPIMPPVLITPGTRPQFNHPGNVPQRGLSGFSRTLRRSSAPSNIKVIDDSEDWIPYESGFHPVLAAHLDPETPDLNSAIHTLRSAKDAPSDSVKAGNESTTVTNTSPPIAEKATESPAQKNDEDEPTQEPAKPSSPATDAPTTGNPNDPVDDDHKDEAEDSTDTTQMYDPKEPELSSTTEKTVSEEKRLYTSIEEERPMSSNDGITSTESPSTTDEPNVPSEESAQTSSDESQSTAKQEEMSTTTINSVLEEDKRPPPPVPETSESSQTTEKPSLDDHVSSIRTTEHEDKMTPSWDKSDFINEDEDHLFEVESDTSYLTFSFVKLILFTLVCSVCGALFFIFSSSSSSDFHAPKSTQTKTSDTADNLARSQHFPTTQEIARKKVMMSSLEKERQLIAINKALNYKVEEAPLVKKIASLRRENLSHRINSCREQLMKLKHLETVRKTNESLKNKIKLARYRQLIMLRNFGNLENLTYIMKDVEWKKIFNGLEEETFNMEIERELLEDQMITLRHLDRIFKDEYDSLKRETELEIEKSNRLELEKNNLHSSLISSRG